MAVAGGRVRGDDSRRRDDLVAVTVCAAAACSAFILLYFISAGNPRRRRRIHNLAAFAQITSILSDAGLQRAFRLRRTSFMELLAVLQTEIF
jgi:hypothetical protein